MTQAVREVSYEGANDPSKCLENSGSFKQKPSPMRPVGIFL